MLKKHELLRDSSKNIEKIIVFSIDGKQFGINIIFVREIMKSVTITPMPDTPGHIKGVIDIRGTIIPVMDIAQRIDLNGNVDKERPIMVIIENQEHLFGILADHVSDLFEVDSQKIGTLPSEIMDKSERSLIFGVYNHQGGIVCIMNVHELFCH